MPRHGEDERNIEHMVAILTRCPGHDEKVRALEERVLTRLRGCPGASTRKLADDVLLNATRESYNRMQTTLQRLATRGLVRRDTDTKPHSWYVVDEQDDQDRELLTRCLELVVRLAHDSDDTVEWMRLLGDVERAGVSLPPAPGSRQPLGIGDLAQRLGLIGARAAHALARATGT